ncbi:hypothetical protein MMC29_006706, partial [Sticta canariensis]|nr:hypothetical protein [Sticta canariensis]
MALRPGCGIKDDPNFFDPELMKSSQTNVYSPTLIQQPILPGIQVEALDQIDLKALTKLAKIEAIFDRIVLYPWFSRQNQGPTWNFFNVVIDVIRNDSHKLQAPQNIKFLIKLLQLLDLGITTHCNMMQV